MLVDGQGFTLYVFAPDKHSGTSKCYGKCANAWPPLVLPSGVNQAPAGSGVRPALLGVTKRADGTIRGHVRQMAALHLGGRLGAR